MDLFKQYGSHSLAFSTIQDKLLYFTKKKGYIAYRYLKLPWLKPMILVLGDPVCDDSIKTKLLSDFITTFPQALFVHVSKQTSKILSSHSFYINKIGIEHQIQLTTFKPSWNSFKFYKSSLSKLKKSKLLLCEMKLENLCKEELHTISNEWIQTQCLQKKSPGFLIRPLTFKSKEDSRFFCAYDNGTLIGYRFFYPIFKQHTIIGYYADGFRHKSNYPKEVTYGLLDYAIQTFKRENILYISLGLSPFSSIKTKFKHNHIVYLILTALYKFGNSFYPFKRISHHKSLFKASQSSIYLASRKRLPLFDMYAVFYSTFRNKNENL